MKKIIILFFAILCLNLDAIIVSQINVFGNYYTQKQTILDFIYLKKNKNYSEEEFDYYKNLSLQFLKDSDFFDKVEIKCHNSENTKIVNVYVKEGHLWKIGANLHSVMVGRNNLFGKGYNFRIRVGEEQTLSFYKAYVSGMSVAISYKKISKRYESENNFWEDYKYRIFKSSLSYLFRLNEFYALKWTYFRNNNFFNNWQVNLLTDISTHPSSIENGYISEFLIDTRDSKKTPTNGFYVQFGDELIYPYKKNIYFLDSYNYFKVTKQFYLMAHFSAKQIDKKLPQYYWQNLDSIFLYHFFNINKKLYKSYWGINFEPRLRWYENDYYFLENKLFYDFCYSSEIKNKYKIKYSAIGTGMRLHIKKYFVTDVSLDISHCTNEFSVYWKIGKRW